MKHYSHKAKQQARNNSNVEFSQEFGTEQALNHLDQEAMHAFLATKAGGMITKRLVELGEEMLVEESKKKE